MHQPNTLALDLQRHSITSVITLSMNVVVEAKARLSGLEGYDAGQATYNALSRIRDAVRDGRDDELPEIERDLAAALQRWRLFT